MRAAVRETLDEIALEPRDEAAAELARTYAATIDEHPDRLGDLGPRLLQVLDALTATPAARAKVTRLARPSIDARPETTPLDDLRAARARRES